MTTALAELLGLEKQPVAIAFLDSPPEGLDRVNAAAPSGCTYWKQAADGHSFYTEASDHYGCPVGSHTHGIDLPEDTAKELEGLVGTMVQLQYISMDEVPQIPQREDPFNVVAYGPLAAAAFKPDVVMVSGTPKQMMFLAEAAHAADISVASNVVGRPTCAAIPAVMKSGGSAANLGCIGNRVYTDMADNDLYFTIAAGDLDAVTSKLETIVAANRELEQFHQARV